MNVLVPSVGRKFLLCRSLREALEKRDGRLIAADVTDYASGGFAAHERIRLPPFDPDSPVFMEELRLALDRFSIDAVIPARDAELVGWAQIGRSRLVRARVFASPVETLRTCFDKWEMLAAATRAGIPCPHTALHLPGEAPMVSAYCPAVIKPRRGAGSREVTVARTPKLLDALLSECTEEVVIQRYVEGVEFSVDCYATADGELKAAVVRKRLSTVGGQSDVGQTVYDEELAALCRKLASALRFRGAINVQFIRGSHGPLLTDVNPRFAGAFAISRAAGADLAEWTIADLCGEAPHFPESYELITWVGYADGLVVSNPD